LLDEAISQVFEFTKEVRLESYDGSPACGPYFEIEGYDVVKVSEAAKQIEDFIESNGGKLE
jgi:hypothetical protein